MPLVAALMPGSTEEGPPLEGPAAEAAVAAAKVPDNHGVWLVLAHRHRAELRLHARMLALSSSQPLVRHSSVVLSVTDSAAPRAMLVAALRAYPQRAGLRVLVQSRFNSELAAAEFNLGYKCGPLHAVLVTTHLWERHAWVLVSHPDVYVTPAATARLSQLMLFDANSTRPADMWAVRRRSGARALN